MTAFPIRALDGFAHERAAVCSDPPIPQATDKPYEDGTFYIPVSLAVAREIKLGEALRSVFPVAAASAFPKGKR